MTLFIFISLTGLISGLHSPCRLSLTRFTSRSCVQLMSDPSLGEPRALDQLAQFQKFHAKEYIGFQVNHDYTFNNRDEIEEINRTNRLSGTFFKNNKEQDQIDHYILKTADRIQLADVEQGMQVDKSSLEVLQVASYKYSDGSIANTRFVHNVGVSGPNINPLSKIFSLQFCFSQPGNERLKVLLLYEQFDEAKVPGTSFTIPLSMAISDVVITREKEYPGIMKIIQTQDAYSEGDISQEQSKFIDFSRFLPDDINSMYRDNYRLSDFEVAFDRAESFVWQVDNEASVRINTLPGGKTIVKGANAEEGALRPVLNLEDEGKDTRFSDEEQEGKESNPMLLGVSDDHGEEEEEEEEELEMDIKVVHAGGLLLELPRVLLAGEETSVKVTWNCMEKRSCRNLVEAEVLFDAMSNALKPAKKKGNAQAQIEQPNIHEIRVTEYSR